MHTAILTPAYGRDYHNRGEVEVALLADNDFILNDTTSPWDGKPVNLSQLKESSYVSIGVRYRNLRSIHVVSIADLTVEEDRGSIPTTDELTDTILDAQRQHDNNS